MEKVREVARTTQFEGAPGSTQRAVGWEVALELRPGPRGPRQVQIIPFERGEDRDRFAAAIDAILGEGLGLDEGRREGLGVARIAALTAVAQLGDEDDAHDADQELCSCLGDGPAEDLRYEAEVVLDDILASQRAEGLTAYCQNQGQGLER